MLTLPFPPRRSHLTAFWLGLNAMAAVVLFLLALALGTRAAVVVVPVLVATSIAVGSVWREPVLFFYRAWRKLSRIVIRSAQWWVSAVVYFGVLPLVGRAGTRLEIHPGVSPRWQEYEPGTDPYQGADDGSAPGAFRRLRAAARAPERAWWLPLLPLFAALSFLHGEAQEEDLPSNIYTLY
jgi:hypothetical protein